MEGVNESLEVAEPSDVNGDVDGSAELRTTPLPQSMSPRDDWNSALLRNADAFPLTAANAVSIRITITRPESVAESYTVSRTVTDSYPNACAFALALIESLAPTNA